MKYRLKELLTIMRMLWLILIKFLNSISGLALLSLSFLNLTIKIRGQRIKHLKNSNKIFLFLMLMENSIINSLILTKLKRKS